jgi:hypothetical protein
MQKKDIAIIAVRLLALYILLMTVEALPTYVSLFGWGAGADSFSRAMVISSIIAGVLNLIIGIGLWFYSTSLANLITKDLPPSSSSKKEFTLASVQTVAVSLIGVFILSSAIPAFFEIIISYIFPASNPSYTRTLGIGDKWKVEIPVTTLVRIALKLGLGFWFLLGANGIVTAIREIWAKSRPMKQKA